MKLLIFPSIVLAVGWMVAVGFGISAAAADPLTIVAFGDSVTARHPRVSRVYADRLPDLLSKRGLSVRVINSGVGSAHTGASKENGRHRGIHALDRLQRDVCDHKPDVVIVQFGWNDSWVHADSDDAASTIPLKQFTANLETIAKSLRKQSAKVVLVTPNRPRTNVETWRVKRTERYVNAVRKVADQLESPLVDVWQAFTEYDRATGQSVNELLRDKIHPNDQGHRLIADLLARKISALQSVKD